MNDETYSNDSTNNNMDVIFLGSNGNDNHTAISQNTMSNNKLPNKYSSCKTLQRKLELKVERAKRNYSQKNGSDTDKVSIAYIFLNLN